MSTNNNNNEWADLAECMSSFKAGRVKKDSEAPISQGRYRVALGMARKKLEKASTEATRREILADIRLLEECTASKEVVQKYTL